MSLYANRLLSCCGRVSAEFSSGMNFLVKGRSGVGSVFSQCIFVHLMKSLLYRDFQVNPETVFYVFYLFLFGSVYFC